MKRFREWWRRGWKVPDYHWVELLIMRIGLAAVAWISLVGDSTFLLHEGQPHPQGIAHWIPLSWLSDAATYGVVKWIFIGALVVYVSGQLSRIALPVATLIHVLVHTLHNSQGATHHHAQIVSLVLLAQCLTHWWPSLWSLFQRLKGSDRVSGWVWSQGRRVEQWAVWFSLQAIAATYLLAALSKLIKSKGIWAFQSHNIVVEMVKTHWQNFYSRLEHSTDPEALARMNFLLDNPNAARLILGGGLALELFAFLMLYNRATALVGGLLLISMHLGIGFLMKLHFPHNEQLLLLFAVNLPFWLFFVWWRRDRVPSS